VDTSHRPARLGARSRSRPSRSRCSEQPCLRDQHCQTVPCPCQCRYRRVASTTTPTAHQWAGDRCGAERRRPVPQAPENSLPPSRWTSTGRRLGPPPGRIDRAGHQFDRQARRDCTRHVLCDSNPIGRRVGVTGRSGAATNPAKSTANQARGRPTPSPEVRHRFPGRGHTGANREHAQQNEGRERRTPPPGVDRGAQKFALVRGPPILRARSSQRSTTPG
jgi:hypothetical protein